MPQNSDTVVLVADDEPSTLALVVEHVRAKGFKVIEASDGDMAWQLAHQHLPDLVILDVMMPGMSGWEVCRKIREALPLAHTGVIMLTGIGQNLNEMTSPLYGADTHVDKPFEFSDLDEKITQTLSERRRGAYGRADGADVETPGGGKSEPAPDWDGDDDAPMTAPTGGPLMSKVKRAATAPKSSGSKEPASKPASSKPASKKAPAAKSSAAPKKKAAKKAAAKKAAKKVAKKAAAKKKPALAKKATGKKASKKAKAAPAKKASKKAAKKSATSASKKKASKKKAGKKKSR